MRYREIADSKQSPRTDSLSGLQMAFLFSTFPIQLNSLMLTRGGRRLSAPAFPVGATSATSRQALISLSFFGACRLFSSDKRDKQVDFVINQLKTWVFLLVGDKLAISATSFMAASLQQAISAR
ncbi:hypothetical protein ELH51_27380 [Rhizobium ruizarguesonis]|uniref:hypothetical protein n=1 Tax=Rhizobium ruizarguesonis TaxID=2081791 RepID=UPI001030B777|nr:hypothetical protein [Rhizobium ruizarguesonis]TBB25206.1 hypothetical protein ELH51_27380 [Rhizobium ruizarguesonis]